MPPSTSDIKTAIEKHLPDAQKFLSDIIAIPSLGGDEAAVMDYAFNAFAHIANVEKIPLTNALRDDPLYSDPIPDITYNGRYNIRAI